MKLAVYGTLKRGLSRHELLAGCEFLGGDFTLPIYTLWDLGAFPAATLGGSTSIQVEVYNVPTLTLTELDRVERHPHLFERLHTPVYAHGRALMYVLTPNIAKEWCISPANKISAGVWPGT